MFNNIIVKNSLMVEIYTLGFNGIGEANLFLVKVDDSVHLSFLIDYYQNNNSDEMKAILNRNGVESINYIIWTHPHEDHTKGLLDVIKNFSGIKTQVLYPGYLLSLDWEKRPKEQKDIISLFKDIQSKKEKVDFKLEPVAGNMDLYGCTYKFGTSDMELKFIIYTPRLGAVEQKFLLDDEDTINDFSISCCIEINKRNFVFAGDIQNNAINGVNKHLLPYKKGIELLKVPHHGSETSTDIISWISEDLKIGTSIITEYSRSDIPRGPELELYKNRSETTIVIRKKGNTERYGLYHGIYNILTDEFSYSVKGNALDITS